ASYKDYLASDLWKEVRSKVYRAKGGLCYLCGAQSDALHHNRYSRADLLGQTIKFINPICDECHKSIEFQDGKKVPLTKAARKFKRIRNSNRREKRHLK